MDKKKTVKKTASIKKGVKKELKKEVKKAVTKKEIKRKYVEAIGKRKEAVARVRLIKDKPGFVINERTMEQYFPLEDYHKKILDPFKATDLENSFFVSIKVKGGGITGQAEAIRLGISRCLIKIDEKLKPILRKAGFLTRDARKVERKKYGLKKARKAPQWSKR
jgi:small subunit ribosomal protein S9